MPLAEILTLVGQWGLPTVLTVFLFWAYDRQQKKHDADRKAWDEERTQLWKDRVDETDARIKQAEVFGERSLKSQEIQLGIVNKTQEMLAQAALREKELRDEAKEREREMRASHPQWGPAKR